jgi:hypothetical protein
MDVDALVSLILVSLLFTGSFLLSPPSVCLLPSAPLFGCPSSRVSARQRRHPLLNHHGPLPPSYPQPAKTLNLGLHKLPIHRQKTMEEQGRRQNRTGSMNPIVDIPSSGQLANTDISFGISRLHSKPDFAPCVTKGTTRPIDCPSSVVNERRINSSFRTNPRGLDFWASPGVVVDQGGGRRCKLFHSCLV